MEIRKGTENDIVEWMRLVRLVSPVFPGLESQDAIEEHKQTVLKFIRRGTALCADVNHSIVGILLFSREHHKICCLAVDPAYCRQGIASSMLTIALYEMERGNDITVSTFREDDDKGKAPRSLYMKFGFTPEELTEEFGYPNQVFRLHRKNIELGDNDGVLIRKAGPNAENEVAALASRLWPDHTADELAMDFKVLLKDDEAAVFLSYHHGVPIGFAQSQLRHDYVEGTNTSPVGYLEGIYVAPEHRGNGVAKALLKSCETWAAEKGCREFASDCELDNVDSLAFHLAAGFTEVNRIICFTKKLVQ